MHIEARLGPAGVIQVHIASVLGQVHSPEGHLSPQSVVQGCLMRFIQWPL